MLADHLGSNKLETNLYHDELNAFLESQIEIGNLAKKNCFISLGPNPGPKVFNEHQERAIKTWIKESRSCDGV